MKSKIYFLNKAVNKTIVLLILEFICVIAPVVILGKYFNFPDILRQPAALVFDKFRSNETIVIISYHIFILSSLLFVPLSYYLQRVLFQTKSNIWKNMLIGFGITTTIFQTIGFIRWIFIMPFLTDEYFSNSTNKETILFIYDVLNTFLGKSVGEHLGFIAMGFWTIALGNMLLKHRNLKNIIGYFGFLIGLLLIISTLEQFGGKYSTLFGNINFIANSLWSVWLIIIALRINKLKLNN
ncbi:DUF4386 domain-containing protein [Yeosuana sp.]|uniref:DUF4386 domain-containing protein n=1 Tax=Yeosuana sp. TaxID=2529388 RepID=UPI00404A55BD